MAELDLKCEIPKSPGKQLHTTNLELLDSTCFGPLSVRLAGKGIELMFHHPPTKLESFPKTTLSLILTNSLVGPVGLFR